jgi:hypothetical protein
VGSNCDNFSLETVPERIRPALIPLLEAIQYAEQTSGNHWEFAVEVEILVALGLTLNDFRWLVRAGLVEHLREVTLEGDNGRSFRSTGDLTFPEHTCFVLTPKGILVAQGHCQDGAKPAHQNTSTAEVDHGNGNGKAFNGLKSSLSSSGNSKSLPILPSWDPERRVLRVNGTLVKQFKWTAENQEAILCVFEEEGWPARIDDPLPPQAEQDSKRRLSDTIKCLNRKQANPIIHFRGDGTGEGIIWELVDLHQAHSDTQS